MANAVCASSLLFPPGERPNAAEIDAAAKASEVFAVSYDPSQEGGSDEGWIELLASGLTFDLTGLAPKQSAERVSCAHFFGLDSSVQLGDYEAISLKPGPHLYGGEALFPVVRLLASLTAQLAKLPKVHGVVWHSARTCSAAEYFSQGVDDWLGGGVFPGLGLTAIGRRPDGGLQTEGLSLFTGQELLIPAGLYKDPQHTMKIALRIVNWLVEHGKIDEVQTFTDPEGCPLHLVPERDTALLHLSKGSN